MKKLFLLAFLLISLLVQSQDFSYGALFGSNLYKTSIDGDLRNKGGLTAFNIGIFGSKKINESFGLQLNAFFGKSVENGYSSYDSDTFDFTGKINVNKFNTQLLLKYDVNESYGTGLYFLIGPRLTFISEAKKRSDETDFSNLYKDSNIGLSGGFGSDLLNHFNIEFLLDYGIPSVIDVKNNKASTFGGYLNILVNIESIINN